MGTFKNEVIVNYPVNEVFNVFIEASKKDFGDFDVNDAIGKIRKKEGSAPTNSFASKTIKQNNGIIIEITDFKINELYEVKTNDLYVQKYEFKDEDNKTKLTITETFKNNSFFQIINDMVSRKLYKDVFKEKYENMAKTIENTIENQNMSV